MTLKGRERDQEQEQLMFLRTRVEVKQKYHKFDISKVCCYNCKEYGHYARECPNLRKEAKKKHKILQLAEVGMDDDPRLL